MRISDWSSDVCSSDLSSHLSLYQLTIEPGTRFATLASRGELTIPGDNDAADLFTLTQVLTAAAGLPAYEMSNHARPGEERRNNLPYWRYGVYAGIGPGAHARRGGSAPLRTRTPEHRLKSGTGLDASGVGKKGVSTR